MALFIASNIRSNVRELEGALIRLVAQSSLIGAEITLAYAQQVLKNFIDSQARKVTIESIQKAVAEQFGLRLAEIKAKNNSRADRLSAADRDVPGQAPDRSVVAGNRPPVRRQAPHHGAALGREDRGAAKNDKDLNRLLNKLTEQLGG